MNGTPINSSKNSIFQLQQKVVNNKSARRKEKLIWLEGPRAVEQCPAKHIKALFLGPNAPDKDNWPVSPYRLSSELSQKVFLTEAPQEVGCLLHWETKHFEDLNWNKGVIIADGLQDPGNAGSLLRTAAGLDYGGFILLSSVEAGNPKFLRSSAGCLLSIPVCETAERSTLQDFINKQGISTYRADANGSTESISSPTGAYALVVGSEAHGLGSGWQGEVWTLPLANNVESLNASVAAALLAYLLK